MSGAPSDWQEVLIAELGHVVTGRTPPTKQTEFFGHEYPFITPTDIVHGERKVVTERFLSQAGAVHLRKVLLPADAVAFVCIGATIGKMCLTDQPSFTNQQINTVIVDQARHDPRFVFYALRNTAQKIKKLAGGAATPIINKTAFSAVRLSVPSLPTQHRIAAILSAYDDLIENNTRRIAILEEMTRRLYEEWFVHLRFPSHESVKMVKSEIGLVPEGWEVGQLDDVVDNIRDGTQAGSHLQDRFYVPIDCMRERQLALADWKNWEEAKSSLILFDSDDILFGAMRPYLHKVSISPFRGVTRTTCFVLRPKSPRLWSFASILLSDPKTVAYADAHSKGTTIPYAAWEGSMAQMPVVVPPDDLLDRFEQLCSPILRFVQRANFRNVNLRTQCDLLLPKLVSGEIDVSEIGEQMAEAAAE